MISSPADLKAYNIQQLGELAEDLRQRIISVCLQNGGHLGASLGAVEIAIALHREMRSPEEPIFWDVGHQAYAHKLLTGRWNTFSTLRKLGGLSGFLSRSESEHDPFGAGHSSTSLSAALAAAWTRKGTTRWSTAIIGDGGLTAGLAFEALQQIRGLDLGPLLIVINDNQMSISPNVGAIPAILAEGKAPAFFDALGLDYVGPMDGHDLGQLLGFLEGLKKNYLGRPVVLHLLTQKGRGYEPAEADPAGYHGISPVGSGSIPPAAAPPKGAPQPSWSDSFAEHLVAWARQDSRVVAITAAMPEGTGLASFAQSFPGRFFDVGIAEGHALTFAAGLAAQGMIPVVALYSTFAQRALDSLIHDIALQGLGVVLALDRAGLVGPDGPTHHGSFDLVFTKMVPNLRVYTPATSDDLGQLFENLRNPGSLEGPVVLRYPRGPAPVDQTDRPNPRVDSGLGWKKFSGKKQESFGTELHSIRAAPRVALISVGHSKVKGDRAIEKVAAEGWELLHINLNRIKPLPDGLIEFLAGSSLVQAVVLEEGAGNGGVGEHIAAACASQASCPKIRIVAYPDQFLPHGTISQVEAWAGIGQDQIESILRKACIEANAP